MKNKKAMISQPMHGKSENEIVETKDKATQVLISKGYDIFNTYFKGEWCTDEVLELNGITNKPLWFLTKSLEIMSKCDAVYFCKGWEDTRGCKIEHKIAVEYGMDIIYEE